MNAIQDEGEVDFAGAWCLRHHLPAPGGATPPGTVVARSQFGLRLLAE
jgi:hypothetical protein